MVDAPPVEQKKLSFIGLHEIQAGQVRKAVPGPGQDHKSAESEQILPLMPGLDVEKGIKAGNKEQERAWMGGTEISEGVNGVRCAAPRQFNIGKVEMRVPGNGELNHHPAFGCCRPLPFLLMRRDERGNEQNPVERQLLPDLLSGGKVTVMDGVERPSHDADSLLHPSSGATYQQ